MERSWMLVFSLKGINQVFWSHFENEKTPPFKEYIFLGYARRDNNEKALTLFLLSSMSAALSRSDLYKARLFSRPAAGNPT